MAKPMPQSQKTLLEWLSPRGATLQWTGTGGWKVWGWERHQTEYPLAQYPREQTVRAIIRRGWVKGDSIDWTVGRITDAGLKALERQYQTTPPPAPAATAHQEATERE